MSKKLSDIRVEIDSIDNQVHDLLMKRAEIVSSVAAAKKKEGLQIVQPAREAKMMRRLLSRHGGVLPRSTVVRIWRELVGSVSLLQTGLSVAVSSDGSGCSYWDMAKNYFGSAIPMSKSLGHNNAISEVREGRASFAVLPWPELNETSPWWGHLFDQSTDDKLSIICALPYGKHKNGERDIFERAVVISKIIFMPSDDDISFIGLKLSSETSRDTIIDRVQGTGISVINLFSSNSMQDDGTRTYLMEVEGFFDKTSNVIDELKSSFDGNCQYCKVVGGYPVIPDIS